MPTDTLPRIVCPTCGETVEPVEVERQRHPRKVLKTLIAILLMCPVCTEHWWTHERE